MIKGLLGRTVAKWTGPSLVVAVCLVMGLAIGNASMVWADAPTVKTPRELAPAASAKLQAIVDRVREDGLPGGVIIRVQSLSGDTVWQGTSGPFAEDQEAPIRPTDGFRIASITKSFTAAIIWRLAEEKRLSVDDPIARYLPSHIVDHIDVINGVSYGQKISIRQLLCHCSGLWDYAVENKEWMRYVFAHPTHQWEPSDLVEIAITKGKPYFKPGEGFHYSDTNYILLGMIIEKITGKRLADVYREMIYQPLGLRATYLEGREAAVGPPRSHNYVGYLDETNFNPTMDAYASGGQVSTAEDLARFIVGVISGHFFKESHTLKAAMALPQFPSKPITERGEGGHFQTHYVFFSFQERGVYFIGHSGFWGAVMFYQPDRDLVITGTGNQVDRRLPLAEIAKAFAGH